MTQPLSIENEEWISLITTRTAGSRLWLINNPDLERQILGCLARYQSIYNVELYSFVIMGNHYHIIAKFPERNRASFMRDFNSAVARLVGRNVKTHGRRAVWARRYAHQVLPRAEDVMHWFMYVALNPVSSGVVQSINRYRSYNSFFDATKGRVRTYVWYDWSAYLRAKRYSPQCRLEDFAKEYSLKFSLLPGLQNLEAQEYERKLNCIAINQQADLVKKRLRAGKGFLGAERQNRQEIGALPRATKSSTRRSIRPLVLTLCAKTRRLFLSAYFRTLDLFKASSFQFLNGIMEAEFPVGTYPPPRLIPF